MQFLELNISVLKFEKMLHILRHIFLFGMFCYLYYDECVINRVLSSVPVEANPMEMVAKLPEPAQGMHKFIFNRLM